MKEILRAFFFIEDYSVSKGSLRIEKKKSRELIKLNSKQIISDHYQHWQRSSVLKSDLDFNWEVSSGWNEYHTV